MSNRVYLYDSTLRDGAQTQGVDFTAADKAAIALALDKLGIDYVEGGWPGANPTDDAFFAAAPKLARAKLSAFGMTRRSGRSAANDPGLAALLDTGTPCICLVGKTWDFHVDVALGVPREENVAMIGESVAHCVARGRDISAINIDNRGGAGEMVRHLVSLGRRRIGFIAGPARNHDAGERLAGYHEALARAELTAPLPALPGDFTEAGGYEAVRTLLEGAGGAGRVDALFAANDSMAVGALSALRRAGIKVPDDVAVVGFDDIPIAAYLSPPLTSMQVPIAELGVRAMEALLSAVQAPGAHEARQEVLPTRLVVRRSCGAPATAAADLGS